MASTHTNRLAAVFVACAIVVFIAASLPGQQSQAAPQNQSGNTKNTRSPHGPLNIPCQNCHTFTGWKPIRNVPEFDHGRTRFPLRGMHRSVSCTQCHTSPIFTNVGHKCADCHADIHRRQMGAECEQCHNVQGWATSVKSVRDHQNRFPLLGAHALVECDSCHKNAAVGRFEGLTTDCVGCHVSSYMNTKSPDHRALGFPTACQQCHTTMDTWQGAKFDHNLTGFALTGAHATLDCASCHVGGKFHGTSANCISCHQKDFNATTNPNHVASGFPTTCQQCHSTTTWVGAKFDHTAMTGFALTGAHITLTCNQCHTNGQFKGTPSNCVGCHQTDFNNTKNPNHVAAGFPTTCSQCHNSTTWSGAQFDHATTGFPLTGAHQSLVCSQCHVNGQYKGTPATCVSCHQADFNMTTNPNHVSAGFPTTCQQCHTTTTWNGAIFNHNTMTSFALTGAHVSVQCSQCHVNGRFAGTPKDCASCHTADFQKTTNPNHPAAGFPTDCSICHTTNSWSGAVFDHSKTLFPLTGAHVSQTCLSCHSSGKYAGLSTLCSSCHLTNFNNATNPNHVTAGFPQTCEVCHSTTAWTPANFDHSKTAFPLTGAHVTVQCSNCHIGGKYAGTPTDCYSCHKTDYTSVTNPNHAAAAFPTTCTTCHNTSSWSGAVFNHTWFPIYSGSHQGKWTTCADCHSNPSNFAVFTCITCHAHDKTTMDSKHRQVRNYVYNSSNCLSCHPSGKAG